MIRGRFWRRGSRNSVQEVLELLEIRMSTKSEEFTMSQSHHRLAQTAAKTLILMIIGIMIELDLKSRVLARNSPPTTGPICIIQTNSNTMFWWITNCSTIRGKSAQKGKSSTNIMIEKSWASNSRTNKLSKSMTKLSILKNICRQERP